MKFRVVAAVFAISCIWPLAACSTSASSVATSAVDNTPSATKPSADSAKPILEGTPLEGLFPTTDEYGSNNGGAIFQLTYETQPAYTSAPAAGPTPTLNPNDEALEGHDCAIVDLSGPSEHDTGGYKEGVIQHLASQAGLDQSVVIERMNSASSARSIFDFQKKRADVCPGNQGTWVFTSPAINATDAVGLATIESPGSRAIFRGYGVRGDLLIGVLDDADRGTDGAKTLESVLKHIDELIAKSK